MSVVVFLGPSVPLEEAKGVLDAIYLPPARHADLLSAVTTYRPAAIGLVDGVFGQSLSVWHKEILFALERGVAVYGASSMGALRAVETEAYGMVGVGKIFRMYREGILEDDDEVAVAQASKEEGFRALSEPMVNIRETLEFALQSGVIECDEHDVLVQAAKDLYFPSRIISAVIQSACAAGLAADRAAVVGEFFRTSYVDVKRADALELLRRLAEREWEQVPARPPVRLTRSHLFKALFDRDRTVRHGDVDVPLENIAAYAALHLPEFSALSSAALNRTLVGILAEVLDVDVDDGELEQTRARLCRRFGVPDDGGLELWAVRQRLEPEELESFVREQAVGHKLQLWLVTRRYLERTTKIILDELRLAGRFEECLAEAALTEQVIEQHYPGVEQMNHADIELETLLREHLRSTSCRIDGELSTWIEIAGFKDVYGLQLELLRARLVRGVLRDSGAQVAAALDRMAGG